MHKDILYIVVLHDLTLVVGCETTMIQCDEREAAASTFFKDVNFLVVSSPSGEMVGIGNHQ